MIHYEFRNTVGDLLATRREHEVLPIGRDVELGATGRVFRVVAFAPIREKGRAGMTAFVVVVPDDPAEPADAAREAFTQAALAYFGCLTAANCAAVMAARDAYLAAQRQEDA